VKLILFDIDGTLLHPDGIGKRATQLALRRVFGTEGRLAEFTFGGKTDWQMLLEILDGAFSPQDIEARLPLYDQVLGECVQALLDHHHIRPCAGAPQWLAQCLEAGFIVALLTANMPTTATLKLQAAGYDPQAFAFGVYGSQAPSRLGLPPLALNHCARLGHQVAPHEALIIGDTPEDIACAQAHGLKVWAVATGRHSVNELARYAPDRIWDDLSDPKALWEALLAG
jgi:phosphoglycolate phosphatase-like HAD superfamily hydrolase